MGEMVDFLDQLARLTLEALLNSVWQGAVIAALVWLLLRVMRGASATTRHAVWMVALFTIGALPFVTLPAKLRGPATGTVINSDRPLALQPATPKMSSAPAQLSIPSGPSRQVATTIERAPAVTQTRPQAPMFGADAPPSVERTFALSAPPSITRIQSPGIWTRLWATLFGGWAPAAIIGIWLAIVVLMLTRILRSYMSIYQLRRKLSPATSEQQRRVERLAAMFGVKRAVRLYTSSRAPMPMTVGSWNPVIILPPDLARTLTASEFDSITAHELAHIKRWDYLLNLLQRTIQAALFFHPAVWFIGKQLLIERELACDDWAVKTCEPCSYASCLTRLVEALNKSKPRTAVRLAAAGILFGKHVITRRVEMILNRERNSTTAVSKSALLYTVGLALSFIVVCSLLQPVIAVPVGQKPAKPRAPKAPKPPTPPSADQAPLPPATPAEPAELGEFPEPAEAPEALEPLEAQDILPAEAPVAPVAIVNEIDEADIDVVPAIAPMFSFPGNPPVPAIAPRAQSPATPAPAPAPRPGPAVLATTINGWGQDDKNRKPAIPEDELISVLTEIVKKDADPAVRSEALQGIYRSRSDAALNALLGLYDSVSDVKIKGEIIPYLVRREGDNTKAVAKLINIAKNEQNEDLRNRAIRYLGSVRGDEGAANLVQIYDSLQDQKAKLGVIRSLGANKSRKALDKLIQIAKNDADPNVRMSAIRALNSVDNRIYLDLLDGKPAKIGTTSGSGFNFTYNAPEAFQLDQRKWEGMADEWRERSRDMFEKNEFKMFQNFNFDNFEFDQLKLDQMLKNLEIELPKIRLRIKDIEDGKIIEKRSQVVNDVEARLAQINAVLNAQLAKQQLKVKEKSPSLQRTRTMISSIEKELTLARQLKLQPSRASLAAPARAASARTSVN